jgi:hypothetical protein
MPDVERVVLTTPWRVVLVNLVVAVAPLLLIASNLHRLWAFFAAPGIVVVAGLMQRLQERIVLTPEGLVIRRFRSRLVPWNHVGGVGGSSFWGELTIWDLTENRVRSLPAPRRSFFRLGSGDVAAAQALIEQWWIAYRGPAPAVSPAGRTPPGAAGR